MGSPTAAKWLFPLLMLLQSLFPLTRGCLESCVCMAGGSMFCQDRRSTLMPLGVPAATRQLYVFQNGITTLTADDFVELGELELLDLSQNELSEIPVGVFGQLTSLRNLDLSFNQITHVSEHSFSGLVTLERLYLSSNRIQSIHPAAFEGLENLLELKLQQNDLTVLPAIRLPKLLLLDISQNRIPPPTAADLQTPNLESLKMAGLGLTDLDEEMMSSLTNLHVLDLSQNLFAAMPPALRSVRGLIRLSLASNQLGQLSKEDFENLSTLQDLNLSNLNLQGFPEGFFQLFPRLAQLTAAENPFNCLCPLAWFPTWLRGRKIELGRKEETRCHFPPSNSGKVLVELDHKDFGCPVTTTTAPTHPAVVVKSTPVAPLAPTIRSRTPTPAPPSEDTLPEDVDDPPPPAASPGSPSGGGHHHHHHHHQGHVEFMCPPNICLNGGTCKFNHQGQVECICSPGTTGLYCENVEESQSQPSSPDIAPEATAASPEPDISSRQVTSTSILLDLHRYIGTRPNIRGIRLTYRNLSGPDQRPIHLSVPASYPEYTLRGLRPNSTYSVCASPMGGPETSATSGSSSGSCMEARTANAPRTSPVEPRIEGPVASSLVLTLAGLGLVMIATAVAAAVYFILRRRQRKRVKAHMELENGGPTPLELEGVKTCLENGALPQKLPEITPCPLQTPNGVEYEALLLQGQGTANNNKDSLKPSYF